MYNIYKQMLPSLIKIKSQDMIISNYSPYMMKRKGYDKYNDYERFVLDIDEILLRYNITNSASKTKTVKDDEIELQIKDDIIEEKRIKKKYYHKKSVQFHIFCGIDTNLTSLLYKYNIKVSYGTNNKDLLYYIHDNQYLKLDFILHRNIKSCYALLRNLRANKSVALYIDVRELTDEDIYLLNEMALIFERYEILKTTYMNKYSYDLYILFINMNDKPKNMLVDILKNHVKVDNEVYDVVFSNVLYKKIVEINNDVALFMRE